MDARIATDCVANGLRARAAPGKSRDVLQLGIATAASSPLAGHTSREHVANGTPCAARFPPYVTTTLTVHHTSLSGYFIRDHGAKLISVSFEWRRHGGVLEQCNDRNIALVCPCWPFMPHNSA